MLKVRAQSTLSPHDKKAMHLLLESYSFAGTARSIAAGRVRKFLSTDDVPSSTILTFSTSSFRNSGT